MLLASPDNPTGRQIDPADLQRLQALAAAQPKLVIVVDETYRDLVYDGVPVRSPASSSALARHTVALRSFSKSHAMAGWRVGYLAAPAHLAARVMPILRASHACASTMAQQAASWILRSGQDATRSARTRRQASRDRLLKGLVAVPGLAVPPCEGGLYLFPWVGGSSEACAQALERGAGVLVLPGTRFGLQCEGHIRICFDREDAVLDRAIERMGPVLRRWTSA